MNPYLKSRVLTASPEELRLMLYDGAIKFCRQAEHAIGKRDWEGMYNALVRAQKILLELSTSLDERSEPELTGRMSALYTYLYRRLVDANLERDASPVSEAIRLLEYERETWQMAMKKLRGRSGEETDAAEPPASGEAPAPAEAPAAEAPAPAAGAGDRHNPIGSIGPQGADGAGRLSVQG